MKLTALLTTTAAAVLAGLASGTLLAQETVLGPIVIVGGLSPMEETELGRSYTVIGSDTLDTGKPAYLADILRQVPGLAVSQSGSPGGITQVRVRGSEANHVLVLIDGVPVSETSTGEVDFGRLQIDHVERIEVLRGPQSAFWGANAMAGVVNIVTKGGDRAGPRVSLGSEVGSDGTVMGSALVQAGQDNFDGAVSLTVRHTEGFNISSFGSELDGATHINAGARFTADVTPYLTLDGTLRYGKTNADFDGTDYVFGSPTYGRVVDTLDRTEVEELFGALGADWISEDGLWTQKGRFSAGGITRDNINDAGILDAALAGERYKGSYQIGRTFETPELAGSEHTITLGYDLVHETFRQLPSAGIFDPSQLTPQDRTTHSLIGEYRGRFADQFYLTAALRHDFNDDFGDATTYSVSGAWQVPSSDTKLHASVGTGSTNPTFYEQFGYTPGTFVGNPNLLPETSFGWDIGVEQTLLDGLVVLDATYFNQNLENEITALYFPVTTVTNDPGISTRQGVELSASLALIEGLTLGASYTYTDARNADGSQEIRRPRHMGAVNLSYGFVEVPLTLHAEAIFNGDMLDTDFSSFPYANVTLPAYTVVNAGLSYEVSDQLEVYGRVENLFDAQYNEQLDINTAGRTFYLGAKASF
ncbi:MAG: TonB-dependent receptor [Devosia sp.]|uniref:TonB-dependent receptor plug domain-containing protein n=1 Tax=Devosia sp. TaxID=1871048 RepID=UPI0024C70E4C|nr:TonB-dependent receptor [Devosia sp.]UYN99615.1 MAG: TonB-dependent receptor [Devosia sp.]